MAGLRQSGCGGIPQLPGSESRVTEHIVVAVPCAGAAPVDRFDPLVRPIAGQAIGICEPCLTYVAVEKQLVPIGPELLNAPLTECLLLFDGAHTATHTRQQQPAGTADPTSKTQLRQQVTTDQRVRHQMAIDKHC